MMLFAWRILPVKCVQFTQLFVRLTGQKHGFPPIHKVIYSTCSSVGIAGADTWKDFTAAV